MYCEDVDLSLRLRLTGGRIAVDPAGPSSSTTTTSTRGRQVAAARAQPLGHDRPHLPAIPARALISPALAAAELAIWLVAIRGGWARMKACATLDVVRALPRLRRERRAIQATRTIGAAAFAAGLTDELSSAYLGDLADNPWVARVLALYWRAVQALLARSGGDCARDWSGGRSGPALSVSATARGGARGAGARTPR